MPYSSGVTARLVYACSMTFLPGSTYSNVLVMNFAHSKALYKGVPGPSQPQFTVSFMLRAYSAVKLGPFWS